MQQVETKAIAFHGKNITFRNNGSLMVNANEMARLFNKQPWKWLQLEGTKEYISALKTHRKTVSLISTSEGRSGATWFHEDVALEFARWLSPEFAIWCNDQIKAILKESQPKTVTLEYLYENPIELVTGLLRIKDYRTGGLAKRIESDLRGKTPPRINVILPEEKKLENAAEVKAAKARTISRMLGLLSLEMKLRVCVICDLHEPTLDKYRKKVTNLHTANRIIAAIMQVHPLAQLQLNEKS